MASSVVAELCIAELFKGGRGCAAPADVRYALPVVASLRGRVPSPHEMQAAGGRAPARAWGRGCCLAPAYSSAPGWLADDRVRFPHARYVGPRPLHITVPMARDYGAPGPSRETVSAGFPASRVRKIVACRHAGHAAVPTATGAGAPGSPAGWVLILLLRHYSPAALPGTPAPASVPMASWPAVLGARGAVACAPRPSARCARSDAPLSSAYAAGAAAASGGALLIWERFPQGQAGKTVRAYAYDLGRRLTSRTVTTDPMSSFTEVTQYAYDAANRLRQRGYADGQNDGFQYDLASRLTVATSARYQNQVERLYDSGGRLTGEWLIGQGNSALPAAWSVWYGYDAANRVRELTYPDGTVVKRDYTARHQLRAITHGGTPVATRTYDAAGKLTQSVLGNGLFETRSYISDSYLVATIQVPGVTEFAYQYDANGRKTTESQTATLPSQTQTFAYDNQDRLTSWSHDNGVVPAQTQTWNLTAVGDWQSTTRDGVVETRQHTDVHEVTRITVGAGPNQNLRYDAKGNLTKDDENRRYTWDPENRLQTARTPKAVSPTGQNLRTAYLYDALGRRVAKTVNGHVTRFISAGAQVVQEEEGMAIAPPAERRGDGDLENLAEEPASGGILPPASDPSAPVLRVNFQPRSSVTPPGYLADKGKRFATRTNGFAYGWSANLHNSDRVQRFAASLEEWDTFIRAARPGRPARTWRIALPNGTYPVLVVSGDAVSHNHTNHLVIAGIPVTDPDPATMATGYEQGDFDGYAVQATVTDGVLTIAPGAGAFDPTLCFIEIGPEGTTITPAVETRLAELVESMTTATYAPQTPSLARRQYVFGTYVDELLSYTNNGTRYFTHANHLYSIAATTNSAGTVVEQYAYDAYGTQTVTNAAGTVTLAESAVGQRRGFTGYILDQEAGLYHARARQYDSRIGRFIGRDPLETGSPLGGYQDGLSLYAAWFVPGELDPFGLYADSTSDGKYCSRTPPCIAAWTDFGIAFHREPGDWWFELGDGSVSWYGVEAVQICANIEAKLNASWTCHNCPHPSDQYEDTHKPIKVCLGIEVPFWLAVSLVFPPSFPKVSVGLALASARTFQRLLQAAGKIGQLNQAARQITALIKTDATVKELCNVGKDQVVRRWKPILAAHIPNYIKINP